MGPTRIMIIRHAEKPGIYNSILYNGINGVGKQDAESLVTMGWERAGGIANLFDPTNGSFQNAELATPMYIYAADPSPKSPKKYEIEPSGHLVEKEPSQRPYQTISALAAKLTIAPENLVTTFEAKHYSDMVADVLTKSGTVLIAWQHEDILPKHKTDDSIVYELFCQTGTINAQKQEPIPPSFNVPAGPWPGDRYDMVFVFDLSSEGVITTFTQVPQMLLAGDVSTLF